MLPPIILCIDDRPQMLNLRKKSLELLGYHVETATNAASAMKAAATLAVAVVMLDYKLEDAQAVAYQLKQRFPSLPIVLLSAYSEMPETLLWLVDEYVKKSEPVERIAGVINKFVSASKIKPYSEGISKRLSAQYKGIASVSRKLSVSMVW